MGRVKDLAICSLFLLFFFLPLPQLFDKEPIEIDLLRLTQPEQNAIWGVSESKKASQQTYIMAYSTQISGFRLLEIPLHDGSFSHFIYIKKHTTKDGKNSKSGIFATNIPSHINQQHLLNIFGAFGGLESLAVTTVGRNGVRCAHVVFTSEKAAKKALEKATAESLQEIEESKFGMDSKFFFFSFLDTMLK